MMYSIPTCRCVVRVPARLPVARPGSVEVRQQVHPTAAVPWAVQRRVKSSTPRFAARCRDARSKAGVAGRHRLRIPTVDHKLSWTVELGTLRLLCRRKSDDFWPTQFGAIIGNTYRMFWRTLHGTLDEIFSVETTAHTVKANGK